MKSPKAWLILVLAVTTTGGGWLAWRQRTELAELRAAAMQRSERADLQKRVWDLEKSNRELRERATDANAEALTTNRGQAPVEAVARGSTRNLRNEAEQQQLDAMRGLLNKPEVLAMLGVQQKAAIDARYAPLFKNLNLSADQVEKLKSLLAERTTTMLDVLSVARDQGVDPRDNPAGFRQLVANAQNEINQSIRGVIGDQGFAQLSTFEQTLPQRSLVNELQQRLSYTNTPLTGAQAEQLVQILAANPPPRAVPVVSAAATPATTAAPVRGTDINAMLSGIMGAALSPVGPDTGRGPIVTPAAVAQSQTILAPPQVAALQQIKQQQQAQQQLRQIVNETLSGGQPAPTPLTPARKVGGKQ